MVEALQRGSSSAGRAGVSRILHDIQDYHVSPQEAALIANQAGVRMLVYYHLLPAPDGFLPRRIFGQGIDQVRRGGWELADDGSLYTLPIGSKEIRASRLEP
jgi:ribonuclease Z